MRRTKEQALATRDAILDAAEAMFHAKGVAQTTLADIASAARVTRGAIYWHFSGKLALFKAITERSQAPEEDFFRRSMECEAGMTLQRLKMLMLEMVRRFCADAHAQRVHEIVLFRCEYVGEMSEAMDRRRDMEEAFEAALLTAFDRARATDDSLAAGWTPVLASACLRCAVLGAISDWLRLDRGHDLMEVMSVLLDSLFAGFGRARVAAAT